MPEVNGQLIQIDSNQGVEQNEDGQALVTDVKDSNLIMLKHMNLVEFLQKLSLKGGKLWIEDGGLCIDGSQEVFTSDTITQLRQYKNEILQLLQESPDILNVYPLSYGQKALWLSLIHI